MLTVDWHCPQCGYTDTTREVPNAWHVCPKMKGLPVQLLRKGVAGKIVAHEREDYIGNETVQLLGADKRPIMSVVTTRDDGEDTVVFAPTANIIKVS